MSGSIVSLSAMALAARALAPFIDTLNITTWRSLIGLVLVVGYGWATGTLGGIGTGRLGTHLIRNIFHFTGQNLWFLSLSLIPLAQVFALEFTSPIWVILLAPLLLGERFTWTKGLCAALGLVGILIVTRPGFGQASPGVVLAAGSALGFAISVIFTKRLTGHEGVISILFWMTVMQTVLGFFATALVGEVLLPDATTFPWLVLIAAAGVLAHLCLTRALMVAPASVVMPIDFARLPVIALIGAMFYAEPLDPWVLLGAAAIFAANWVNIRTESRAHLPQRNVTDV